MALQSSIVINNDTSKKIWNSIKDTHLHSAKLSEHLQIPKSANQTNQSSNPTYLKNIYRTISNILRFKYYFIVLQHSLVKDNF